MVRQAHHDRLTHCPLSPPKGTVTDSPVVTLSQSKGTKTLLVRKNILWYNQLMTKSRITLSGIILLLFVLTSSALSEEKNRQILVIKVSGVINPVSAEFIGRS